MSRFQSDVPLDLDPEPQNPTPEALADGDEDPRDDDNLPDISDLTVSELLELRNRIHGRLPARDIGELNMNQELVMQLHSVQALQMQVMASKNTPANQKAQVANSVAATLQQLAKTQADIYTSERLKRIENVLVDFMKTLPEDQQRVFFDLYKQSLGASDANV